MKRIILFLASVIGCLALSFDPSQASVYTTNADFGVSALVPPTPAPLFDIKIISGTAAGGGIYTNQTSGTAGVMGDVTTIAAVALVSAIDGGPYVALTGPTGGQVIAYAALQGTLAGGVASFNPAVGHKGILVVQERPTATVFDTRDPATWTPAGTTTLGTFDIADSTNLFPSVLGFGLAPVPAGLMNVSGLTPILPGGVTGSLLFEENPATTLLDNYDLLTGGTTDEGGVVVQINQSVNLNAVDLTIPGAPVLDATDLAVLDAFAGLLPGSPVFAAALGSPGTDPTLNFNMNPTFTNEGDFFATFTFNGYPVVQAAIPEPSSVLVWSGVLVLTSLLTSASRRRRSAD